MASRHLIPVLVAALLTSGVAVAQTSGQSTTTTTTTTGKIDAASSWRTSKLMGLDVYNSAKQKIGDINEVLIDKTGKINSVVIGVGGFLGMGEHDVAVPLEKLTFSESPVDSSTTGSSTKDDTKDWVPDHATMSVTKDQLKSMPQFKYTAS
ncbi:sporulation protein YlmC with PRC-barrel domain [Bradyrhizobium sp. AZCC 1588]|uniref:PRC-barrel domain-containing protein n=1 Tax=unclassified Bradyrhizobium TaxID=2631580 RepID=UPI002FF149A2